MFLLREFIHCFGKNIFRKLENAFFFLENCTKFTDISKIVIVIHFPFIFLNSLSDYDKAEDRLTLSSLKYDI